MNPEVTYTSCLIFAATCSHEFGLQTQNARHENKAGQTAGSNKWFYNIIKIMLCVEGDKSDCQPEASSIARSRRLRAVVVVEG